MNRIFFIGPMGAGKSAFGRQLSKRFGLSFVDTDDYIASKLGLTIADYVSLNGEDKFRKVESDSILKLSRYNNVVISTGGGSVICETASKSIKNSGYVIYLYAKPYTLAKRIQSNLSHRFLISNTRNIEKEIEKLFLQREHLYRGIADISLDTEKLSVSQTFNLVTSMVKKDLGWI